MTWHADAELVDAYIGDRLDLARAASVEAHVTSCSTCRAAVAARSTRSTAATARHDATWQALAQRVDQPRYSLVESLLLRCGVPPHLTRLIAAPEVDRGWWFAGLLVLLLAVVMANLGPDAAGVGAFVVLSPVVPVAGVALAYGAMGDPAEEIALVSPHSAFVRTLVRSVAVMAWWLPVAAVLSLALPGPVPPAVWLLPSLTLGALTLALSTVLEPVKAAAVLGGAWLLFSAPFARALRARDVDVLLDALPQSSPAGQAALVALALAAVLVTVLRRSSFERLTTS